MKPQIAMCNIFDQDAEKLAEFAYSNDFSCIDWSIDPSLPGKEFLSLMRRLEAFELRYHCRFRGVDVAFTDRRGDDALELLMRTVNQVADAGGKHMTVHSGLGNPSGKGIDMNRAIDNLSVLVDYGSRKGVAVALENLTTPLTNDPFQFRHIVRESGAYVTVDIGHAHAVSSNSSRSDLFDDYISPHRERVLNAHVYHTEIAGFGHVPPESLADFDDRLDILGTAPRCDWWVIELMDPAELLSTRELLLNYLACLPTRAETALHDNPLPLAAA